MTDPTGIPHVQRCTEVRRFGDARHGQTWQCRVSPAPHPHRACDFGIDAEVFGRDLDRQRPEWLAANLRDAVARQRNLHRRLDAQVAVTIDILLGWATGQGVTADTVAWVQTNAPAIATQLGWERTS